MNKAPSSVMPMPAPTVVVQAHPVPDSYSAALLDRVQRGLIAADEVHDVYRLARDRRPTAADLAEARRLVMVYPTWWGGQPALLLDWLQEMLEAPGSLRSVQELVAVTSLGSSRLLNRIQGEWGRANLDRRVRAACAPGATFRWLPLYKIDRQPAERISAHLDRVEDAFARR